MIEQADSRLTDLRKALRRSGLELRTRRRASGRVFSVRDKESGEVLISGLTDLDEVRNRVWWLLRTRRLRARGTQAAGVAAQPRCDDCGRERVGSFRFCTSCGRDFEPVKVDRSAAAADDVKDLTPGNAVMAASPIVDGERSVTLPERTPYVATTAFEPVATGGKQPPGETEPAWRGFEGPSRPRLPVAWEDARRQLVMGVALGGLAGIVVSAVLAVVGN